MVVLITFELRIGAADRDRSRSACPTSCSSRRWTSFTAQSYFSTLAEASSPEMREGIASRARRRDASRSRVELGNAELNVGDLLALAPGDVIPLAVAPGSDAVVRVGRREAFNAQPGTRGRRAAVQITSSIEDLERTFA